MATRYLLTVPYAEKDTAKGRGAKWDPIIKRWYVSQGNPALELCNFMRWNPEAVHSEEGLRQREDYGRTGTPQRTYAGRPSGKAS